MGWGLLVGRPRVLGSWRRGGRGRGGKESRSRCSLGSLETFDLRGEGRGWAVSRSLLYLGLIAVVCGPWCCTSR